MLVQRRLGRALVGFGRALVSLNLGVQDANLLAYEILSGATAKAHRRNGNGSGSKNG